MRKSVHFRTSWLQKSLLHLTNRASSTLLSMLCVCRRVPQLFAPQNDAPCKTFRLLVISVWSASFRLVVQIIFPVLHVAVLYTHNTCRRHMWQLCAEKHTWSDPADAVKPCIRSNLPALLCLIATLAIPQSSLLSYTVTNLLSSVSEKTPQPVFILASLLLRPYKC